jgi:hypothetical protein
VSIARTGDLWWKNAIVYCLDVETFLDTDGDGAGDLAGLTERIDHLAGLGVTCLWLMPFYPSPNRDDGYDITDYYGVDERLGSLGDFVALVRTAKDRGMRVIVDLVVNHTSDQHPWFRSARRSRNSRYRDYYVWRDEPQEDPDADVVFPDAEDSIWTHDERTDQYYLHHFYSHQPDVNIANPRCATRWPRSCRLLAAARPRRVPDRRGALPAGDRGPRRRARSRARPARVPEGPALVHGPPQGRCAVARRGQPADRRARHRTSATSRPTSCRCCSTSR